MRYRFNMICPDERINTNAADGQPEKNIMPIIFKINNIKTRYIKIYHNCVVDV